MATLPTLPTRSFTTIVQNFAAGVQGRASQLVDFAVGSVLRAIGEATAGVALWLQAMALQVLSITRLSTSYGTDVDSFIADFGIITRLGSQFATGQVTFARLTAGPSAPFIPVGATVATGDGTLSFAVYADPTNTAYSATLNGYTLPAAVASINVPVQCNTTGAAGNVAAGQITAITSALPGIDTVTNGSAFTNGSNSESDAALKTRFRAAILGLARGDLYGTSAALLGAAVNLQFTVTEMQDYGGTFHAGYYYIVVDDGSGAPPAWFLTAATTAANSVRPLGTQVGVFAPTVTTANVSLIITTASGYTHNTVVGLVQTAISNFISGLGLGNGLPFTQIANIAYSVAGVTNVTAITLNSGTADIAASPKATIKPGTITVS